jgi:hypothetical protein
MAVTYSRYKFITAPLPKRQRNGSYTSETAVPHGGFRSETETATWIKKWFEKSAGVSRLL